MTAPAVTVGGLLDTRPEARGLPLEVLSGAGGLDRPITSQHIQKTGLALAGFDEYLQPGRILVFGESEVRFLDALEAEVRLQALAAVFTHDVPCILITGGWEPPSDLRIGAERAQVPLLRTAIATPLAIARSPRCRGPRPGGRPGSARADVFLHTGQIRNRYYD